MKVALVFVVVAISLTVASGALTCLFDENKCEEDECCIKVTNLIGRCKKLKEEDEKCEVKQIKPILPKHAYKVMCPCREGLKCVAGDGLIGRQIGTCQVDSSETEAPEE